jgi:Inositol polyphosphate kinase
MQSLPSLKKKVEEGGLGRVNTSASSLDLRKVATAVPSRVEISPEKKPTVDPTGSLRRRYSAGNLRDHSEEDERAGGVPSEEDDEHLLPLNPPSQPDPPRTDSSRKGAAVGVVVPTYAQARQNWAERCYQIERSKRGEEVFSVEQGGGETRTEWFLLIENLTKNMIRPCVLDLKMGTRQYGVHSSPGKRASQRKKYHHPHSPTLSLVFGVADGRCARTTSRELGVRICGMQVWDARNEGYIFQDKYFGRDLKSGRDFQLALTRYITSTANGDPTVLHHHIPTIYSKITHLGPPIRLCF